MSITKTGILNSNRFIEGSTLLNQGTSFSYTPEVDKNNATSSSIKVDLSPFKDLNVSIALHIECDFTWGDFSSGTGNGGTFRVLWSGSNYPVNGGAAVWQGTNYIMSALENQKNGTRCINEANTGGSYHYNTYCIIPASWFQTYEGSNVRIRTDYSNGIGTIQMTNLKVTVGTTKTEQAYIASNYINANNFYEY